MPEKSKLQSHYYIGIMSGTSLDGVDVVLVEFTDDNSIILCSSYFQATEAKLQQQLLTISNPKWRGSLSEVGMLHQQLGTLFANAVNALLAQTNITPKQIKAIGSHGQTVWHQPTGAHPFSMQLGDANQISELTGITTVADFRNRDIAAKGQGAPLVPAFHQEVFSHPHINRVILNIGGIANITLLPASTNKQQDNHQQTQKNVSGFDTGPGNGLIDAWVSLHKDCRYDKNGDWGKSGKILKNVLTQLLNDVYFSAPIPKSTGKEVFNLAWLNGKLKDDISNFKPEDIQATLTELTATTIADSIKNGRNETSYDECFVCGGGVHNQLLMERLQIHLPDLAIHTTHKQGIDPDWLEAIAFAWLAKQTIEGKPSNLPSATGAKGLRVLGAIYHK